jgi:aryl-alcohol dehydrogenase-like predicted oxidoreductase
MHAWQFTKSLYLADLHGWTRFVSMQNHYNLLYREEEREMIPLCVEEGLGVIPWSPLARGLLARPRRETESRRSTRSSNDPYAEKLYSGKVDWPIVDAAERIAEDRRVSMAEVALAWLLSRRGVTAPIVGATKIEQLESSLRAVDLELTPDEIARLDAPYTPKRIEF